jgi:hypothetical protein
MFINEVIVLLLRFLSIYDRYKLKSVNKNFHQVCDSFLLFSSRCFYPKVQIWKGRKDPIYLTKIQEKACEHYPLHLFVNDTLLAMEYLSSRKIHLYDLQTLELSRQHFFPSSYSLSGVSNSSLLFATYKKHYSPYYLDAIHTRSPFRNYQSPDHKIVSYTMNQHVGFGIEECLQPQHHGLVRIQPHPNSTGKNRVDGLELFRSTHLHSASLHANDNFVAIANNTRQKWIYLWSLQKQQFVQIWKISSEKITYLSDSLWCMNNDFAFLLASGTEKNASTECLVYHPSSPSLFATLYLDCNCHGIAVNQDYFITVHIVSKNPFQASIKKWNLADIYAKLIR